MPWPEGGSTWRPAPPLPLQRLLHHAATADVEGRALVQLGGLQIEDAGAAIGGQAARLLHQEGQGVGLVEQTELALGGLARAGVEVDAALEQVAVEVGHQTADVSGAVLALLAGVNVAAHGLVELEPVALVDGVDLALGRRLHAGVAEAEGADAGVEGETVHAVAGGV